MLHYNDEDIFTAGEDEELELMQEKYLVVLQRALRSVQEKFEKDLTRLQRFVGSDEIAARHHFNSAMCEIASINHENLVNLTVSLTDSKSIHFKIFTRPNFEAHLEVFYLKEDEEDQVEAVLGVFENDHEILKNYGQLEDILLEYRQCINRAELFEPNAISL